MRNVITTSEILEETDVESCPCEVIATGTAEFDEAASALVVHLDSFLRPLDTAHQPRRRKVSWLPKPETVREEVPFEESRLLAKDVFESWARRVRRAIPAPTPV